MVGSGQHSVAQSNTPHDIGRTRARETCEVREISGDFANVVVRNGYAYRSDNCPKVVRSCGMGRLLVSFVEAN